MAEAVARPDQRSLRIGNLIGETFSILGRRFVPAFAIALVPALCINGLFSGLAYGLFATETLTPPAAGMIAGGWIVSLAVISCLPAALIVQLAEDARLGREAAFGRYFRKLGENFLPILVLSLFVSLFFLVASLALVLPGLYLLGCWAMMLPAILIEDARYGALGRSYRLTRDYSYRWPIVGTMLLFGFVGLAVMQVATLIVGSAPFLQGTLLDYLLILVVPQAVLAALQAIFSTVLHARLREIEQAAVAD